jgi:hypothetical protein
MSEKVVRLAAVLVRAEQVHGVVTERTEGFDPEWALFYAWWLVKWSDLPEILGSAPGLGDLTARLIALDAEYRSAPREEPWSTFYARQLLANPPDNNRI